MPKFSRAGRIEIGSAFALNGSRREDTETKWKEFHRSTDRSLRSARWRLHELSQTIIVRRITLRLKCSHEIRPPFLQGTPLPSASRSGRAFASKDFFRDGRCAAVIGRLRLAAGEILGRRIRRGSGRG